MLTIHNEFTFSTSSLGSQLVEESCLSMMDTWLIKEYCDSLMNLVVHIVNNFSVSMRVFNMCFKGFVHRL